MEQQRLKRCFKIKDGFLFVKLINFDLLIEYMNPKQENTLYRVRFKKYLKDNLLDYFNSTTHFYKYLTEFPYKIINITERRMQIVATRAYKHSLVTLQLQKIQDLDEEYLFRLKMLILKERVKMQKISNAEEEDKNQEVNKQLQALLVEAKQKYHLHMLKLESYQSTLKEKESQLKHLQEQIKLKTIKLSENSLKTAIND